MTNASKLTLTSLLVSNELCILLYKILTKAEKYLLQKYLFCEVLRERKPGQKFLQGIIRKNEHSQKN